MEGRGRSRARKKRRYASPKRLLSFLLTAAMVLTNMGPDLSLAYAATATDVTFEMEGADLVQSVEDAIAEGNEVEKGDIDFTEGAVDKFENLFFGEGKLYEAYPEMEGGDAEAELRVFVRLPEDADDTYIVTGDEDLIFLYVNNGEDRITCRTEIHRVINGRESTKTTKKVSIKSYLNAYDTIFGEGTEVEEEEEVVTATSSDADKAEPEVPTATDSDGQVSLSVNDAPLVAEAPVETATDSDAPEADGDEAEVPEDTEAEEPAEEEEITEDADEEVPEAPKATDKDLVALDWNRTAKAWVTSLNALGLERSTEEGSYVLTVNHILTDGGEMWGKEETIELTEEDFTNGVLNTAPYEYVKDGMELAGKAPVVRATDFQGEDGAYELTVDMEYRVMDGWHIVRETAQPGIMLMAIYIGELDDVDIVQDANQIPVYVRYLDENGVTVKSAETIMAEKADTESDYQFSLTVDVPSGYTISVDDSTYEVVNGNTITASFDTETEEASLDIIFVADKVDYTIKKHFQSLSGDYPDDAVKSTTAKGKAGEVTEVVAGEVTGFTAEPIVQKVIEDNGSTVVDVYYVRNAYTVTYNTNGGSYIKALTGLYEDTVTVYESERKLNCELEVHTHTSEPTYTPWNSSTEVGCWKWSWRNWSWQVNCGQDAHTHTDKCYVNSYDPAPTKQGYTFAGWYKDEACTQPADTSLKLEADITVYAKWTSKNVSYRIVYMIEQLDADNNSSYVYKESELALAPTGSTVSGTNSKSYPYYEYNADESTSAVVKPDGSTVVYVYYDLKEYTLTFDLNDRNAEISIGDNTYTGKQYSIKIKLGMDISDVWPTDIRTTTRNNKGQQMNFYAWTSQGVWNKTYVTKRFVVTTDMLPRSSSTFTATANWRANMTEYAVEYWLQDAAGSQYVKSDEYSQRFHSPNNDLGAKTLYGFTHIENRDWEGKDDTTGLYTYRFYYNRNKYNIIYYSNDRTLKTVSNIFFGADISDRGDYKPSAVEAGLDSEYTFVGWYDNSELAGAPYEFTVMPGNTLPLYAKWSAPIKGHAEFYV